jgi:O-antigen ligase
VIYKITNYQEILINSTLNWQFERARVSGDESIILSGVIIFLCLSLNSKKLFQNLIWLSSFFLSVIALIITQSRGFWLAMILCCLVVFFLSNRTEKIKMLSIAAISSSAVLFFAVIFFSEYIELISKGLLDRFSSISATQLDTSLLERVKETRVIWDKILKNPISGYGFGTNYIREYIFYNHFIPTTYIHNGYLSVWYKFGLFGLLTFLSLSVLIIYKGNKALILVKSHNTKSMLIASISLIFGLLLVNITSPQYYSFDGMLLIGLIAAFISLELQNQNSNGAQPRPAR